MGLGVEYNSKWFCIGYYGTGMMPHVLGGSQSKESLENVGRDAKAESENLKDYEIIDANECKMMLDAGESTMMIECLIEHLVLLQMNQKLLNQPIIHIFV